MSEGAARGPDLVGTQIGSYRITREIGRGGMGIVYEAVHGSLGQRIAVKVLFPDHSSDAREVQRFFDEARAVTIVEHPGLVKILDAAHLPDGTAYIAMEHLQGESLQERLLRLRERKQQLLPLADVLRLSRQIASTLEAVHHKGIAHRDLKPANLFIVPDREAPGGERIKILDFGIAKFFGAAGPEGGARHQTTVGKLLGTPAYMSPEQSSGAEQVDDRADVYALGVIMYQMISGQVPFDAPAAVVIMSMHITQAPRPLGELQPDVPEAVATLVHQMLSKRPAERPPMAEVARRLEELLESLPTGRWLTLAARTRVRARRTNRRTALSTLLFVAATAGLWGLGRRRRRARDRGAAAVAAPPQAPTAAPPPAAPSPAPKSPQPAAAAATGGREEIGPPRSRPTAPPAKARRRRESQPAPGGRAAQGAHHPGPEVRARLETVANRPQREAGRAAVGLPLPPHRRDLVPQHLPAGPRRAGVTRRPQPLVKRPARSPRCAPSWR